MTEYTPQDTDLQAKLKGKVVLVTGANSGIGRACVQYYQAAGCKVVWSDLRNNFGEEPDTTFVKCDVTLWSEQLVFFETAIKKYGRIDSVVANAGVGELFPLFKDDLDSAGKLKAPNLKVIDVNVNGVLLTTKLAFHYFKKQQPQGGDLVLIGSMASFVGETGLWLLGLMRATRAWTPTFNTRINLIGPYMTESGLMNDALRKAFAGFPVQEPTAIAKAAANFSANSDLNGKAVVVGNYRIFECEEKLARLQPQWMGKYITDLKERGDGLVDPNDWIMT